MNEDLRLHGLLGGGSNIKSAQSGATSLSAGNNTVDVTISSVDVNKSIILITGYILTTDANSIDRLMVATEFINPTTIRFRRNTASGSVSGIRYQVIEFNNVKSKQSGIYTFSSPGDPAVTVSAYTKNKSMFVFSAYSSSTSTNTYYIFICGEMGGTTTIYFHGNYSATYYCQWQLLEFN